MSKDFKAIAPIPNGTEMVDIILSKTQRKTPTVVRPGYTIGFVFWWSSFNIKRIQAFYMRKVKFTQQNTIDKLQTILDQFPRLEVEVSLVVLFVGNSSFLCWSCECPLW